MSLNHMSISDEPKANIAVSIIPKTRDDMLLNMYGSFNGSIKKSFVAKLEGSEGNVSKKSTKENKKPKHRLTQQYLSVEVMRKMLKRLLFEKRVVREALIPPITKEEIARTLGVGTEILDKILLCKKADKVLSKALMGKINLPLIMLYCATRFEG